MSTGGGSYFRSILTALWTDLSTCRMNWSKSASPSPGMHFRVERERARARERAREREGSYRARHPVSTSCFCPPTRCRATMAHIRQSRPGSGLGSQTKFLNLAVAPALLGSGLKLRKTTSHKCADVPRRARTAGSSTIVSLRSEAVLSENAGTFLCACSSLILKSEVPL